MEIDRAWVEDLLSELTIDEKIRLTAGKSFWTTAPIRNLVPSITLTDGPNGLRKQLGSFDNLGLSFSIPSTCFPCEASVACSFDEFLVWQLGRAIGEECREEDISVLLGPAINIKRHPLAGRNFEYFSEDPYLTGKLAVAYVKGLESTGVVACPKHFAANSQETRRMTSDSIIDDRTLNEIYLRAFEMVVKEASPHSIMSAYNLLNGLYCSENPELMRKLREYWGFEGAVVTDWGALSKSEPSIAAGLDLVMPGPRPEHIRKIRAAVQNGSVSIDDCDRAASNVLSLVSAAKAGQCIQFECDYADHLAVAQVLAEASGVLLENDGTLPISKDMRVALIGEFAKKPRYQGSGSSKINPIHLDNLYEAFEESDYDFQYARGYDSEDGSTTSRLMDEAIATAKSCDVSIVLVGLPDSYESEGIDRDSLELPIGMNSLVDAVSKASKKTVVLVYSGGPCNLPWRDSVSSIFAMYLPGSRGGHAAFNLLTGAANPSGKLAETWPKSLHDTALGESFLVPRSQILYTEAIFVGYRYYTSAGVEVAYPFGHGLSYSSFEFSDLEVKETSSSYTVSCKIENASSRDGCEVVQLYLSLEDAPVPWPKRQLAAFKKVFVKAHETVEVQFDLDAMSFSFWDVESESWRAIVGDWAIEVGSSCEDIRLSAHAKVHEGSLFDACMIDKPSPAKTEALKDYYDCGTNGFSDECFLSLYGKPLPPKRPIYPFTIDSRLGDLAVTPLGRKVLWIVRRIGTSDRLTDDVAITDIMSKMLEDLPLRSIVMGKVPYRAIEILIDVLNRDVIGAIKRLIP